MKECTKCKDIKTLENFYKSARSKDGLSYKCKPCIVEYNRIYRSDEKIMEKNRQTKRTYRQAGRDNSMKKPSFHNKAHTMVERAIKRGDLIPPLNCQCCKVLSAGLLAHHDDYGKPLEVRWVCPRCHQEIHKKIREAKKKEEGRW
jgi:ribosomal protein S27AE